MSDFQLKRGDLVSGVYRVKAMLGRGGFAEVYRVEHMELNRELALKLFSPRNRQEAATDQRQQRFLREARAIHDLRHPGIVRLHHYGLDEEGRPFLVMDYVEGRALSSFAGRMAPARAFRVIADVLTALHAVHETGLLHRDVKPSNVMLGEEGGREWVKLIDFGVAKHYDRSRRDTEWLTLTKADTFIGTPAYTAPELLLNEDPSPASDVYSAGLVLYELVFGERAVSGGNSIEILSHQLQPREFELPDDPELTPAARAVLEKMIAKDPSQRFSSAREAAAAVTASMEPGATVSEVGAPADEDPPRVSIAASGTQEPKSAKIDEAGGFRSASTRRRTIGAVVFVAVLLLVGVVFAWMGAEETVEEENTDLAPAETAAPLVINEAEVEHSEDLAGEPEVPEDPSGAGDTDSDATGEQTATDDGEGQIEEQPARKRSRADRKPAKRRNERQRPKERKQPSVTFKPEPVD